MYLYCIYISVHIRMHSINYISQVSTVAHVDRFILSLKGILSTTIVIFSYPKLLLFSALTFIKWKLTPSYATKDTIFWQKRPKTIIIGIIVQNNKNSNLFIWLSMWTRHEHAHCLETINNMWFLGNAWKKAVFDGFREKDE